jgi:hypothetical protein
MFAPTAIVNRTAKLVYRRLREVAYDDMARQASDWIPEELRIEKKSCNDKPIELDFGVPKKHRLDWIRRTIQYLPH